MANNDSNPNQPKTQPARRYRYRTLREDYVEFCGGNTVAALLLDYFASIERNHDEQRLQGERPSPWRSISGKFGGLITILQPTPKRETVYRALNVLIDAGLIEAHPENGQSTKPNQTPTPNRFRLIAWRLRRLEHDWAATSHAENVENPEEGVLLGTYPPVLLGTHESEVLESEREYAPALELPDHVPPAARKVLTIQPAQPDGGAKAYTLIEAYCDAWDVTIQKYRDQWHRKHQRGANDLAALDATPDEIRQMVAERRANGKQPDEYPMSFLAMDYVGWKVSQEAKPKPHAVSDIERAAQEKALEAERLAWRKEQGLL